MSAPTRDSALVRVEESSAAGEVEVELDGTTRTVSWPPGNKLLEVLLDAGIDAPHSCWEGGVQRVRLHARRG